MNRLRTVLLCVSALGVSACAITAVPAWEKGTLAKPEMRFDNDPLAARTAAAIYHAKEAASGGAAAGAGGCGCN